METSTRHYLLCVSGIYYALTLVVTCSVTCTEVLILELHFRSQHGDPIPPRLVRAVRQILQMIIYCVMTWFDDKNIFVTTAQETEK